MGAVVALSFIVIAVFVVAMLGVRDVHGSVYYYSIKSVTQTSSDTIVVAAECEFCNYCNPNDNNAPGCDPFEPGDPAVIGSGYWGCGDNYPDGRFAAVRLVSAKGLFNVTQKLVCNPANWPLGSLYAHSFVFSGLTLDPTDTITAYADFYCSWCGHWYSAAAVVVPQQQQVGQAWIVRKSENATVFNFGDLVEVTIEVDTSLATQNVIVDSTLLDPLDVVQDHASWSGAIVPGPDPIVQKLAIPTSGIAGSWRVMVNVYNSTGGLQDSETNYITVQAVEIESCDSAGNKKDTFNSVEIVYAKGSGYLRSRNFNLTIVPDTTWVDGMPISGMLVSVSSDASGNIQPTAVWNPPLNIGKFDIVVDVNGNGIYDAGIDALDDNDVVTTAGFLVVPELPMGALIGIVGCFAALGTFRYIRKRIP